MLGIPADLWDDVALGEDAASTGSDRAESERDATPERGQEEDGEWIFGRNPVREVLAGERSVLRLLVADGAGGLSELIGEARAQGVAVQHVPRVHLDRLCRGLRHQGVAASVAAFDYTPIADLLERAAAAAEAPFLLFLDEVQDPQNFGSILRTAEAAGVQGVVVPRHRSAGLTAAVARSSAGAVAHIPVARVANLANLAIQLKEQGYWLVGTDGSAPSDYREVDYSGPIIVAIGGEGHGLGRALAAQCDWMVRLPMRGRVTSLNASVAAALVLYQVVATRVPVPRPTPRGKARR